ncbi:hypothetical protein FQR65_LT09777 [Abscondita terminalis]|nr:hypothetical protein FQR65_LT09777 [Abscondita terminalis]
MKAGLILIKPARSTISNRKYCGFQHSDDYNRTNRDISIDEFPWMVQLLYNNGTNAECSGSLINDRYVLAAAHCLINRFSKLTAVRLGDHNVKTAQDCNINQQEELECTDSVEDISIDEVNIHTLYNKNLDQHDIGLIRLARSVTFSEYIRPICLPERDVLQSNNIRNFTSSGWGKLGFFANQTEIKKRVTTKLVSYEECYKDFSRRSIIITKDQLCGRQYNSFTCSGDSGGPLMHSFKNQWEQVGVISFAAGCGEEHIVVFAKVFNYLDWIVSTVRP